MNIHEYQAQRLLRLHHITVPEGEVASNIDEALAVYAKLDSKKVVVKAQVHAGGRGQAGGIRIVDNKSDLQEVAKSLLGTNLVTYQTDTSGQPINNLYIVKPCQIERELYLSALFDRTNQCITFMVCAEGGVDIEAVAKTTPEKIYKFSIDPLVGILSYQCWNAANTLKLTSDQKKQFTKLIKNIYTMFLHYDLTLLEINPLVIDKQGDLICLDAKINIDDNALYRQPDIREMRDPSQEDERESIAKKWELNYISLEGNIGCMVNGAGLAMATMDLIKLSGGKPANFLDVGGGVTKERVTEAFKIILSDKNVKAILINIFGGIVRCDLIAEGIIQAVAEVNTDMPVIARLEGNNADLGNKKLTTSGLNIVPAKSFAEAAKLCVQAAKENND
ncbi:MAG: ADP-forming succinate--CoA ligase subunit beta [Pseudomonadota bacterium]|nr:ADP-forming succinate--CoA ligase subunit beta [Pseudomonadota bacterium]